MIGAGLLASGGLIAGFTNTHMDCNEDGQIDKLEFNGRLIAIFNSIDSKNHGMLGND